MGNCIGGFRISDEELEIPFLEYYLLHGKAPRVSDISSGNLPSPRTIKFRTGRTYNEHLEYLGIPLNKRSTPFKTDAEMLSDLLSLAEELGRTPSCTDLVGREGMYGKSTYSTRFGSWSKALMSAGIKPAWRPVSDNELLRELQRFHNEVGRSPTTRDTLSFGSATFSVRFGCWNNALIAAGLSVNENIYGAKTIGKDGITYDSISESIIANWLYDNDIEYKSHVPYFDKLVVDFKVGDVYIEFFGLPKVPEYAVKMKLKRRLCMLKGYSLIELFSEDLTHLDDKLGHLKEKGADLVGS